MLKILTTSTFCLLMMVSRSQKSEPEFLNHIYHMADTNKFEALEKTDVAMKSKSKLGGFGGATSSYVIEGGSSSVSINNQQPSFAIKLNHMMDPSQMIQLFHFDKKDKSRESIISKMGMMGKNSSMNQGGIRYNIKKGEKGIYIIVPEKPLPPGEYGFINMMMMSGSNGRGTMPGYTVFAFAIR